jgi:hypothetical protein
MINIDERYGKRFKTEKTVLKRKFASFTERAGHAIYGATMGQKMKNSIAGKLGTPEWM